MYFFLLALLLGLSCCQHGTAQGYSNGNGDCQHLNKLPHYVQMTQWDCLAQDPECHDKCVFKRLGVMDETEWPKPWEIAKEFAGGNVNMRLFNSAWRAFAHCSPSDDARRGRRSTCQDILTLVLCAWQQMYQDCGAAK